jgi:hypothetical protein
LIASVHLADVGKRAALGLVRRGLDPAGVPGLRYAEVTVAARLGGELLPAPQPGRVGLIAGWADDQALDAFLATHPLAARLGGGWHTRLEPLRVSGHWSALPDLPRDEQPVDDDEPVAILTLGRLRVARVVPFLRASAAAEGQAVADPALLAGTGLARPPRLVATFSVWRSAAAMRAYAYGRTAADHVAAVKAHNARSFHHESAFVRFRPYDHHGTWDGCDPLATVSEVGARDRQGTFT